MFLPISCLNPGFFLMSGDFPYVYPVIVLYFSPCQVDFSCVIYLGSSHYFINKIHENAVYNYWFFKESYVYVVFFQYRDFHMRWHIERIILINVILKYCTYFSSIKISHLVLVCYHEVLRKCTKKIWVWNMEAGFRWDKLLISYQNPITKNITGFGWDCPTKILFQNS